MVATEETEKGGLPARRILGERGTMAQEPSSLAEALS